MERYEILMRAAMRFNPRLNELPPTTISTVGNVVRSICRQTSDEISKRADLDDALTAIIESKKQAIGGNKQSQLREVIDSIYSIQNGKITNPDLEIMN